MEKIYVMIICIIALTGWAMVIYLFKNYYTEYHNLKRKHDVLFCESPGCTFLKYYQFKHCTIHHIPSMEGIDTQERDRVHPEPLKETYP